MSVDNGNGNGDTPRQRFYRKIIKIRGQDSPNVRINLALDSVGLPPDGRMVLPGVLPWNEYLKRRATWDPIKQCIGLDAEFYEGAEVLLFPPEWLNRSERIADTYTNRIRYARAIGIDPAEGGDKTAMAAVDEFGLIELVSKKTPDTSIITAECIAFAMKHGLLSMPECWVFDRGGGGKEHADRLREQGYEGVRTVAFGETLILAPRRGMTMIEEKIDNREERYAYVNRRAEMYGTLRILLDPSREAQGLPIFAIPSTYTELRRQLAPIPLTYDPEGRMKLLPKNKRNPDSTEKTLTELIGCSPDEADSLVLAIFGMVNHERRNVAGAI